MVEGIGIVAVIVTSSAYIWQIAIQLKSADFKNINLAIQCLVLIASCLWVIYGISTENQALMIMGSLFTSITLPVLVFKIQSDLKLIKHKKKHQPIQSRYDSLRKERL